MTQFRDAAIGFLTVSKITDSWSPWFHQSKKCCSSLPRGGEARNLLLIDQPENSYGGDYTAIR
ncbi:hypothetical protein [Limnospira platensis]|uniref:hypothetical protein n=1 Tax=Limnospira platensis TaxID=118562 RepID=UPI0002922021|nr:hypothetical protein AP285_18030 [Arthrospira platensis YZ]KDR56949.1 hypothetical protein APPUASWS_013775 [Arthrospira platensis str. Paraca]MDT9309576.1 hypothetical protein [Limnospira sp. Paracas R14]